jgi:hypothetical protein
MPRGGGGGGEPQLELPPPKRRRRSDLGQVDASNIETGRRSRKQTQRVETSSVEATGSRRIRGITGRLVIVLSSTLRVSTDSPSDRHRRNRAAEPQLAACCHGVTR